MSLTGDSKYYSVESSRKKSQIFALFMGSNLPPSHKRCIFELDQTLNFMNWKHYHIPTNITTSKSNRLFIQKEKSLCEFLQTKIFDCKACSD